MIRIVPSILSADFTRLGEDVRAVDAAGADRIQIDIMDGRFVPNITFGTQAVESVRPITSLPLEAHLMVEPPEEFIEKVARAGADTIIVHYESTPHVHRALQQIRALGKSTGLALNPSTAAGVIEPILNLIDMVLVMTVNPGFGGQEFIPETLAKIREVRGSARLRGREIDVEVDGGINLHTVVSVVEAGANVLVAGSSVFDAKDGVEAAIKSLRAAATGRPA